MRQLAVLIVGALVGGCSILPAEPEWMTNRRPLPACGVEWVTDDGGMDGDARRCVLAAWQAGEGAELITHLTTADGDAVTRYLRVHPNGFIEIFVDATLDALGSGQWERFACDSLAPVADDEDAALVFTEQGCEAPTVP